MKILICGHKSLAARGLVSLLSNNKSLEVECFSRGKEKKEGMVITGDVYQMKNNLYLQNHYDIVINYILIKDGGIDDNLKYLSALVEFCKKNGVKRLVHISTISVYPNDSDVVNEDTPIEKDINKKGVYGALKIKCDEYLSKLCESGPELTFLRPGYIVEDGEAPKTGGIMIALPLNGALLLGDRRTSLPLIYRSKMNLAIYNLLSKDVPGRVFLLLENKGGTKYAFIRKFTNRWIIWPPKNLAIMVGWILKNLGLFSENKYHLVKGLFKDTYFDSSKTEELLSVKF